MIESNLKHVAVYDKFYRKVLLVDYVTDYRGVSYYTLKYTDMIRREDGKRVPGPIGYDRAAGIDIPRRAHSVQEVEALAKNLGLVHFEF